MAYIFILIVLAIFAFSDYLIFTNEENGYNKYSVGILGRKINFGIKNIIAWLLIVGLILFAGLRYYSGFDYGNYSIMFYKALVAYRSQHVEYGYYFLNRILGMVTENPQWIFFIMAAVTLFIKGTTISKLSKKIWFSIFIYYSMFFLVYDMGQIRSSLAQALGLFAMYLFTKNRKKTAFICILIAACFHTSSIILMLLFFIKDKRYSAKQIIITYIVFIILGQLMDLHFVGMFAKEHIHGNLGIKIYRYTASSLFAQKIGLSANVIFDFIILVMFLLIRWYNNVNDKKFDYFFNIYFTGICIYLLFNRYFVLGTRFSDYFKISIVILLPMLIGYIKNKNRRMLFLLFFMAMLGIMVFRQVHVNSNMYTPYAINWFGHIITR